MHFRPSITLLVNFKSKLHIIYFTCGADALELEVLNLADNCHIGGLKRRGYL